MKKTLLKCAAIFAACATLFTLSGCFGMNEPSGIPDMPSNPSNPYDEGNTGNTGGSGSTGSGSGSGSSSSAPATAAAPTTKPTDCEYRTDEVTFTTPTVYKYAASGAGSKLHIGFEWFTEDGQTDGSQMVYLYKYTNNAWEKVTLQSYNNDNINVSVTTGTTYYYLTVYNSCSTNYAISDLIRVECGTKSCEKIGYIVYGDSTGVKGYCAPTASAVQNVIRPGVSYIYGIVVATDDNGNPTRFVSIKDERLSSEFYVNSAPGVQQNLSKDISYTDGSVNCTAIKEINNWGSTINFAKLLASFEDLLDSNTYYKQYACTTLEWYVPAIEELVQVAINASTIRASKAIIKTYGGVNGEGTLLTSGTEVCTDDSNSDSNFVNYVSSSVSPSAIWKTTSVYDTGSNAAEYVGVESVYDTSAVNWGVCFMAKYPSSN